MSTAVATAPITQVSKDIVREAATKLVEARRAVDDLHVFGEFSSPEYIQRQMKDGKALMALRNAVRAANSVLSAKADEAYELARKAHAAYLEGSLSLEARNRYATASSAFQDQIESLVRDAVEAVENKRR